MDRIIEVINVYGLSKKIEYTNTSQISKITDENNNTTKYIYDKLDRLIEVIDANSNSTKYIYDSRNNIIEMNQFGKVSDFTLNTMHYKNNILYEEMDLITKYKYDKRGLLIEEINPVGKIKSYKYDSNVNVK